jgi:hypothetical protein
VGAPFYIGPEFGGQAKACGPQGAETRLSIASAALPEPVNVSLTCVDRPEDFPAPAPSGRLPLAVVDAAPALVTMNVPVDLTVSLPPQPRYGAGVVLDLLRLDLDRMSWAPAAQLTVDPGGRTASGQVGGLGTYLVVAPPFGQFRSTADATGSEVYQFAIAPRPDSAPVDVFGPDTPLVYAGFDFARMENTPILVRTVDEANEVVFESHRPYTGDGRDNVPMVAPDGRRWPVGRYITTLYTGDPPFLRDAGIEWRVAAQPTPAPAPRLPIQSADVGPVPYGEPMMLAPGCPEPANWYSRIVYPGETLSGWAFSTGASVGELMARNCLSTDQLRVGQTIFLPQPPIKPGPFLPAPPVYKPPVNQPPVAYPTWWIPTPQPTFGPPPGVPTMPWQPERPFYDPGMATPWKTALPPAGWTAAPPPPMPPVERPVPVFPTAAPPVFPPSAPQPPPAPPPAALPPPVAKWTPQAGPEPTLAPRPTFAP